MASPPATSIGIGIGHCLPVVGPRLLTATTSCAAPETTAQAPKTASTMAMLLENVAAELGRDMAQVAINWVATQPAVASVVLGASSSEQLDSNLAVLDFDIPDDARHLLDKASTRPTESPYSMFTSEYQSWVVSPGLGIGDKPVGYTPPVFNGTPQPTRRRA